MTPWKVRAEHFHDDRDYLGQGREAQLTASADRRQGLIEEWEMK